MNSRFDIIPIQFAHQPYSEAQTHGVCDDDYDEDDYDGDDDYHDAHDHDHDHGDDDV